MAFKRSAVRSRLSPPKNHRFHLKSMVFLYFSACFVLGVFALDNKWTTGPLNFFFSYCGKEYYIKFLYCIKARTPNERKIKGGGGIYGYAWASRARKSADFHRFRCISLDYCGKYVEITRHTLFLYVYVTISRIFQEIPGKSLTIYIKSIYNGMCKRRVARVLHIFCCAGMDFSISARKPSPCRGIMRQSWKKSIALSRTAAEPSSTPLRPVWKRPGKSAWMTRTSI